MDELKIPYHLAIPAILCFSGLGLIVFIAKKLFQKRPLFWACITVFLILYLVIVGRATFDSMYFQWDLNRYDLNNDGFFTRNEITNMQCLATKKVASDTGRNLSFITGFVFSGIVATFMYLLGKLAVLLRPVCTS